MKQPLIPQKRLFNECKHVNGLRQSWAPYFVDCGVENDDNSSCIMKQLFGINNNVNAVMPTNENDKISSCDNNNEKNDYQQNSYGENDREDEEGETEWEIQRRESKLLCQECYLFLLAHLSKLLKHIFDHAMLSHNQLIQIKYSCSRVGDDVNHEIKTAKKLDICKLYFNSNTTMYHITFVNDIIKHSFILKYIFSHKDCYSYLLDFWLIILNFLFSSQIPYIHKSLDNTLLVLNHSAALIGNFLWLELSLFINKKEHFEYLINKNNINQSGLNLEQLICKSWIETHDYIIQKRIVEKVNFYFITISICQPLALMAQFITDLIFKFNHDVENGFYVIEYCNQVVTKITQCQWDGEQFARSILSLLFATFIFEERGDYTVSAKLITDFSKEVDDAGSIIRQNFFLDEPWDYIKSNVQHTVNSCWSNDEYKEYNKLVKLVFDQLMDVLNQLMNWETIGDKKFVTLLAKSFYDSYKLSMKCWNPMCHQYKYYQDQTNSDFQWHCLSKMAYYMGKKFWYAIEDVGISNSEERKWLVRAGWVCLSPSERRYTQKPMWKCKRCRIARYCSKKCQKVDWNIFDHKKYCKLFCSTKY